MTIEILDWTKLPQVPWHALLLGNGASVALHSGFLYSSLREVAEQAGKLATTKPIFTSLGTNDFEHVLLACWYAATVGDALGSPVPTIKQAYTEVRDALIHAVQQTHCTPASIRNAIQKVGDFAKSFPTVVTLNYDLTFYWAMLEYNSQHGLWFKDGFINGTFDPGWPRLRQPYGGAGGATLVFYAHGALMLARDLYGVETKLDAKTGSIPAQTALLSAVTSAWSAGQNAPIFVSEGTSPAKLRAIRRSPYLTSVYDNVLSNLGDNIVVYGLSFSDNDQHILDALKRHPPRLLAVSVYGGQTPASQQTFCHTVSAKHASHLPSTQLVFFNSSSPGVWNN